MELTDLQLVERARQGDNAAFHELVDRHANLLYRVAVRLVGHDQDAQDVVQETLLGAFEGLANFRGQAAVKTWLVRILVNQAARHRRKLFRGYRGLREIQAASAAPETESAEPAVDARLDMATILGALPEEQRQVIVLRELEQMSYQEIADVLGLPRGTVESRLFRARQALQEKWSDKSGPSKPESGNEKR